MAARYGDVDFFGPYRLQDLSVTAGSGAVIVLVCRRRQGEPRVVDVVSFDPERSEEPLTAHPHAASWKAECEGDMHAYYREYRPTTGAPEDLKRDRYELVRRICDEHGLP